MDEVAATIGIDPVELRLRHVKNPRDVAVIKALLVVCKVPQVYGGDVSERVVRVIEDGLRPR